MDSQKEKDVKDTAMKLQEIYMHCPEDFFFLKGWIHCLLQKENTTYEKSLKSSTKDCTSI